MIIFYFVVEGRSFQKGRRVKKWAMYETEKTPVIRNTDILMTHEERQDMVIVLPILLRQQGVLVEHPTLCPLYESISPLMASVRSGHSPEACAALVLFHQAGYLLTQEQFILLSVYSFDAKRHGHYHLYCCALDYVSQVSVPVAKEQHLSWLPIADLMYCAHVACQLGCLLLQKNILNVKGSQ
jgi:hypothetical protein